MGAPPSRGDADGARAESAGAAADEPVLPDEPTAAGMLAPRRGVRRYAAAPGRPHALGHSRTQQLPVAAERIYRSDCCAASGMPLSDARQRRAHNRHFPGPPPDAAPRSNETLNSDDDTRQGPRYF